MLCKQISMAMSKLHGTTIIGHHKTVENGKTTEKKIV